MRCCPCVVLPGAITATSPQKHDECASRCCPRETERSDHDDHRKRRNNREGVFGRFSRIETSRPPPVYRSRMTSASAAPSLGRRDDTLD
jgi:hypothetical protein